MTQGLEQYHLTHLKISLIYLLNLRYKVSTGCCPNPLTKSFKIDIMGKTQRRITVPAMMSYQDPPQRKLFYMGINLDKRIRKNHPLRKIRELIDFDFIYKEVEGKYGYNR